MPYLLRGGGDQVSETARVTAWHARRRLRDGRREVRAWPTRVLGRRRLGSASAGQRGGEACRAAARRAARCCAAPAPSAAPPERRIGAVVIGSTSVARMDARRGLIRHARSSARRTFSARSAARASSTSSSARTCWWAAATAPRASSASAWTASRRCCCDRDLDLAPVEQPLEIAEQRRPAGAPRARAAGRRRSDAATMLTRDWAVLNRCRLLLQRRACARTAPARSGRGRAGAAPSATSSAVSGSRRHRVTSSLAIDRSQASVSAMSVGLSGVWRRKRWMCGCRRSARSICGFEPATYAPMLIRSRAC